MALSVTITGGTSPVTYKLPIEELTIAYDRSPFQIPLPDASPELFDLGQFKPSIKMTGILASLADDEGGVTIPSKRNLEDAAVQWHDSTITLAITLEGLTDSYICKIFQFTVNLVGGRNDVWQFTMQLVTQGRT